MFKFASVSHQGMIVEDTTYHLLMRLLSFYRAQTRLNLATSFCAISMVHFTESVISTPPMFHFNIHYSSLEVKMGGILR